MAIILTDTEKTTIRRSAEAERNVVRIEMELENAHAALLQAKDEITLDYDKFNALGQGDEYVRVMYSIRGIRTEF